MTFTCKQCNHEGNYKSHKEAYMAGWYVWGMTLKGNVIPKDVDLCYKCGNDYKNKIDE